MDLNALVRDLPMSFDLSMSPRLRVTPFTPRVEAAGAKAYTIYNHMMLATVFRSVAEDCAHLKEAVQIWDVSAERQVEIVGPDAAKLVQYSTPRDISRMADDQCYYIPTVDARGAMTNDPVLNKLGPDRFWVSIASSDLLFYYKALAIALNLDVQVFEPDVHPLAIQGPKSFELVRRLWGDAIADLRFFRHGTIEFNGRKMMIARSGWSVQGGFEIYVDGAENGLGVWDMIVEEGRDLDIHAGCPNGIERIEGGLLSYGNDMTLDHSPFEAGLGKYVHAGTICLGDEALATMTTPTRQIRPVEVEGPPLPALRQWWSITDGRGTPCGTMSSAAYSPDFGTNVAIAMMNNSHWSQGDTAVVHTPDGDRAISVRDRFWL